MNFLNVQYKYFSNSSNERIPSKMNTVFGSVHFSTFARIMY